MNRNLNMQNKKNTYIEMQKFAHNTQQHEIVRWREMCGS
jgi:hypothetical protein